MRACPRALARVCVCVYLIDYTTMTQIEYERSYLHSMCPAIGTSLQKQQWWQGSTHS